MNMEYVRDEIEKYGYVAESLIGRKEERRVAQTVRERSATVGPVC